MAPSRSRRDHSVSSRLIAEGRGVIATPGSHGLSKRCQNDEVEGVRQGAEKEEVSKAATRDRPLRRIPSAICARLHPHHKRRDERSPFGRRHELRRTRTAQGRQGALKPPRGPRDRVKASGVPTLANDPLDQFGKRRDIARVGRIHRCTAAVADLLSRRRECRDGSFNRWQSCRAAAKRASADPHIAAARRRNLADRPRPFSDVHLTELATAKQTLASGRNLRDQPLHERQQRHRQGAVAAPMGLEQRQDRADQRRPGARRSDYPLK